MNLSGSFTYSPRSSSPPRFGSSSRGKHTWCCHFCVRCNSLLLLCSSYGFSKSRPRLRAQALSQGSRGCPAVWTQDLHHLGRVPPPTAPAPPWLAPGPASKAEGTEGLTSSARGTGHQGSLAIRVLSRPQLLPRKVWAGPGPPSPIDSLT